MVGYENWDGEEFEIIQTGSHSWRGKVMVWKRASGSHGRKSKGTAVGDWRTDDIITLQTCSETGMICIRNIIHMLVLIFHQKTLIFILHSH